MVTRMKLFKAETNWPWLQLSAAGCKRIIVDPQYLESLNRPNVSLKWDAIEAIVEDGIKLKTGVFIPLDVIIFGTGYSLVCIHMNHDHEFLATYCSPFIKESPSLNAQGSSGNTIPQYFESKGGAQAYLGSCFPGFPNLFTLLGKLLIFLELVGYFDNWPPQDPMLQLVMRLWFLVKKPRSA